ncbi:MAG: hypothetical protein K6U74_01995 [Firmicutes bacterium]|nr:hypothetical protein [Bacillota bacterium]
MINHDPCRKCRDCGEKIYPGEPFYAYESEDGSVREVCGNCLSRFLEALKAENDKKPIL